MFNTKILKFVAILTVSLSGLAQTAPGRFALILEDPPTAQQFASREAMQTAEASDYRRRIEATHKTLRDALASRKIQVTGAVDTVLNAIFVLAPKDRLSELKSLPGVKGVVPLRRYHMDLNRATQLLNAPGAWNSLGGVQNAGSGVKIAILDSGIDQTHAAFQDSSLPMPAGYPICSGGDCAFTTNKVIVARSYVRMLAAGSAPNPAADSRPDDYSPRDRVGHGTAVASCAAGEINTGLVMFSGMAPKAYLGNYKIYGSPGLNDGTTDDVIIQALEDAFNDRMDIVSFSSGGPAFTGPLDSGSACGNGPGVSCDLVAQTFENVANKGMIIVAAAGNEGLDGVNPNAPTFNSISSPADAPSVIAAGATTNSHTFSEIVSVPGSDTPSNLKAVSVQSGDADVPTGSVTASLRDVTQVGDDGYACSALPAGSLVGAVALIERGSNCSFAAKLGNAEDAGAVGAIFYMADQTPTVAPGGLASFPIPAVVISNSDGLALKSLAHANPGHAVTIDPAGIEQSAQANEVAGFSSIGPTTGDSALKPDLVAVGTNLYMAGQSYDPAGALYSSDGYVLADGASFSTPLIAGAAALVKQEHPGFTAAQVKSALVNTAAQNVLTDDASNPVDDRWVGGGQLDAGAAVNDAVTATPSSLSFGALLPRTQQLQIANGGAAAVNLAVGIAVARAGATLTLDKQSLSLAPHSSATITVSLSGAAPSPGSHSGAVTIQGQGVSLRVPYLSMVGSGVPANLIPLTGVKFRWDCRRRHP